jgi:hypothetical protein
LDVCLSDDGTHGCGTPRLVRMEVEDWSVKLDNLSTLGWRSDCPTQSGELGLLDGTTLDGNP